MRVIAENPDLPTPEESARAFCQLLADALALAERQRHAGRSAGRALRLAARCASALTRLAARASEALGAEVSAIATTMRAVLVAASAPIPPAEDATGASAESQLETRFTLQSALARLRAVRDTVTHAPPRDRSPWPSARTIITHRPGA